MTVTSYVTSGQLSDWLARDQQLKRQDGPANRKRALSLGGGACVDVGVACPAWAVAVSAVSEMLEKET